MKTMHFFSFQQKRTANGGFLLIGLMVFAAIAIVVVMAFVSWGITSSTLARRVLHREQSLQIAEAGIEYTRWYLAHYQTDYRLGTGNPGPYTFDYKDKDGTVIGTYTLTVTPPSTGSTVVTIQSKGVVSSEPIASRTIRVKLAIPSLAKYSVLGNSELRFGQGTVVYGPIHSNGGIRFDGLAYNLISSAKTSYDDPDHTGTVEFGVHTHLDTNQTVNNSFRQEEAPPTSPTPTRNDVFKAGRQFPVPAVDFVGITNDLATIKSQALANGKYIAPSGSVGYQIILKPDDTYDLYKVTAFYSDNNCKASAQELWSIKPNSGKTFIATYPLPNNGLIFVEDTVWVEGTINTARITIAAAAFPDNVTTRKNIIINNNLRYTNYDGSDVIALIAQNNINVGLVSLDSLRIDAALIAQNGRVGRNYYGPWCPPYYIRSTLNLYGMIGSNQRYGFAYTDGTGYTTRIITYDTNLLYAPPPNFPLASDKYQIISWEELET